jgi:hypothetical protein
MARGGKKGRSGPPGNVNNCKHPWRILWSRGALRTQDRWVLTLMAKYLYSLCEDKGGRDVMSFAETRMAELAQTAYGCQLLIIREMSEEGVASIVERKADMSTQLKAPFRELPRFMSIESQSLMSLGLQRRARPEKDLNEILASIASGASDGEQ